MKMVNLHFQYHVKTCCNQNVHGLGASNMTLLKSSIWTALYVLSFQVGTFMLKFTKLTK